MQLAPIPVRTPFPWAALLDYLSVRLVPDIERIEDGCYWRRAEDALVKVSFDTSNAQLNIEVDRDVDVHSVRDRVARLFDVGFVTDPVARALKRSAELRSRIDKLPGLRPLAAWSPFELCVRTILGQQVTVAAAATLMRRWVQRCGAITPECVLAADLTNIGMPGRRVESIRGLARATLDGQVDFARPWSEVDAALRALPGFGPWTRDYLAIRLGREPDAFPASDLGLIRAANASSPKALLELAEQWRPYRAYAATYLWVVSAMK